MKSLVLGALSLPFYGAGYLFAYLFVLVFGGFQLGFHDGMQAQDDE